MSPFRLDGELITAQLAAGEVTVLADLARQLIDMLEDRAAESPADLLYAQLGIGGPSDAPLDPALARLHIVDDGDEGTGDPAMQDIYDWLGYLQVMLVEAIDE